MKVFRVVMLAGVAIALATCAFASDFNFGSYARSEAMGGAGLALTDDPTTTTVINPAAGAAKGQRFQFVFPSIDFHVRGATLSDLFDRTSDLSDTGSDDVAQLAKDFAGQDTTFTLGFSTGFSGPVGFMAEGEAQAHISPSPILKKWAEAGAPTTAAAFAAATKDRNALDPATIINDPAFAGLLTNLKAAAADWQANPTSQAKINQVVTDLVTNTLNGSLMKTTISAKTIYSLPSVMCSYRVNGSSGDLLVGTKLRWLNTESKTWNVQQETGTTDISFAAVEDATLYKKDHGLGMDLGFIYQPQAQDVQYALVINNFLDPRLMGVETPTSWNIGIASKPNKRLRWAIDLVNINNVYGEDGKLRMGAEWTLDKLLVLRAGNQGKGWTYGVGILGFNFSFSSEAPNMVGKVIRF